MQSWEEPMEPSEAERTIVDVERVRHGTRQALNPIWYPNIAFGLFFAGTAIVALLDMNATVASAYWVLGGLLVISLVVRHYARVERALGVESPMVDASTFILLALVAGVVLANVLTEGDANAYAPLYVGAAATIAMGLVLDDRIELAAGAAIALVATGIVVLSPTDPGIWGNLGLGLALLVAGLVGRERA
jgi:K+ transporter